MLTKNEVEKLKKEVLEQSNFAGMVVSITELNGLIETIEDAIKTIKFYADPKTYDITGNGFTEPKSLIENDEGEKAQDFLKSYNKEG
jgi:biotin synthase-like enzyme